MRNLIVFSCVCALPILSVAGPVSMVQHGRSVQPNFPGLVYSQPRPAMDSNGNTRKSSPDVIDRCVACTAQSSGGEPVPSTKRVERPGPLVNR